MTATPAPDPRFRDQIERTLVRSGVWPLAVAEAAVDALLPVIAAELARVKAAAGQQAAEHRPYWRPLAWGGIAAGCQDCRWTCAGATDQVHRAIADHAAALAQPAPQEPT